MCGKVRIKPNCFRRAVRSLVFGMARAAVVAANAQKDWPTLGHDLAGARSGYNGINGSWDSDTNMPCNEDTGSIAWRTILATTDALLSDKQRTTQPDIGGSPATARGLMFINATGGGFLGGRSKGDAGIAFARTEQHA